MMRKIFGFLAFLAIMGILVGCSSPAAIAPPAGSPVPSSIESSESISTRITPQPGDIVNRQSTLLAPLSIEQMIKESSSIVIGKVVAILPSQEDTVNIIGEGENVLPQHKNIYTDVVIQPERYLYGQAGNQIAVRISGGRVDNQVMIAEDEPVFTTGEEVVIFLYKPDWMKLTPVPQGIEDSSYFLVKGYTQGKYKYEAGNAVRMDGSSLSISDIEAKIEAIHKGG